MPLSIYSLTHSLLRLNYGVHVHNFSPLYFNGKSAVILYLWYYLVYEGDISTIWKISTNADRLVYRCGHHMTFKIEIDLPNIHRRTKLSAILAITKFLFSFLLRMAKAALMVSNLFCERFCSLCCFVSIDFCVRGNKPSALPLLHHSSVKGQESNSHNE